MTPISSVTCQKCSEILPAGSFCKGIGCPLNPYARPAPAVEASELVAHILVLRCAPKGSTLPLRQHYCSGYDDGIKAAAALAARQSPAAPADLAKLHAEFGFPESQNIDTEDMIKALREMRKPKITTSNDPYDPDSAVGYGF